MKPWGNFQWECLQINFSLMGVFFRKLLRAPCVLIYCNDHLNKGGPVVVTNPKFEAS